TVDYQGIEKFYAEAGYRAQAISAAELDLLTRRIAAMEALSRYNALEPAWVSGFWPNPKVLPTAALVNLFSVAGRMTGLPNRTARMKELEQLLRARLDLQGRSLTFAGEEQEDFFWSMISGDVTAVRFVAAVLSDDELFGRFKADAGRLVQGILLRQRKGHWDLTTANAWGRLALQRHKERSEGQPVQGTSSVALTGAQSFEVRWGMDARTSTTFDWPPESATLSLSHAGSGAPWVSLESRAAVPRTGPLSAGYRLEKKIEPVQQRVAGEFHVGDVVRVRIAFTAQAARTWVVIDDPIPAGASILGTGLERDSALLTAGGSVAWNGPTFEERGFGGYRGYFRELPKGDAAVEYVMRLNTVGAFVLPATRMEAMYSPEVFGEIPNAAFAVLP
ncbi:MAG: alpha-2-macroglobulin, partial [Proteobacteria bacterium]|nr:alpha-2-macroglobulin [Pseudomonadota bacterium]